MGLGKNKKKQWRKCVPGIEEDLQKAVEVSEIDDISFEVSNKTVSGSKTSDIKYSTVPRTFARRPNIKLQAKAVVDVWSADYEAPQLSKRQKKLLAGISRVGRPQVDEHPGTSYRPTKAAHADLLSRLQADTEATLRAEARAEKRMEVAEEEEAVGEAPPEEEEEGGEGGPVKTATKKPLARKDRLRRLGNLSREKEAADRRRKEREEAHLLRNLDRLGKEGARLRKRQEERREAAVAKREARLVRDEETAALGRQAFLLPSQVPVSLRTMVPDCELMAEVSARLARHGFKKAGPKRALKAITRTIRKTGLAS